MFEVERETERGVFMTLELKNIGMIKEASVKIDGLTVIAGENDTGKSTVGKAIFLYLHLSTSNKKANSLAHDIFGYGLNPSNNPEIGIDKDKEYQVIMIETPLVWSFTDFFRDIAQIESQFELKLDYPYLMKDLNFKLHIKSASNGLDIKEKVTSLMGGEFKKDEIGRYYFDKKGQRVELVNTATGIKYFGIFQVLSQNNYLNKDTVLVLDEPEVHLHPKWQLEMAKIIVELVKNGVKIVVNSHSPYMIEALERYAEKAEVPADFYLAEGGFIDKVEDNNSKTLAKIFHKLSAPYETFNQMDSETLKGG